RAGERGAGGLAVVQLAHGRARAVADADALQRRLRVRPGALRRAPPATRRDRHLAVEPAAVVAQEQRIPDGDPLPDGAPLGAVAVPQVDAVETHRAAIGLLDPGGDAQQRRASGAAPAPHADDLARVDLEADVVERDPVRGALSEALADRVEHESGHQGLSGAIRSSAASRASWTQDKRPCR